MKAFRSRTVAGVVAWKFTAMVLLPLMLSVTAGCPVGRDVVAHDETVEDTTPGQAARITACDTLDDTLLNLLSLPGFTPEAGLFSLLLQSGDIITFRHPVDLTWDADPLLPPPRVHV
ncbi:MAG: hypothetical protein VB674_07250 [Vicinamibacterales bacterium]